MVPIYLNQHISTSIMHYLSWWINTLRSLRLGHTPTIIAIYGTYGRPSLPGTVRWDICHILRNYEKYTRSFFFQYSFFGFMWLTIGPRINLLALLQSYDLIALNSSDGTRRIQIKQSVPNHNKIEHSTKLAYFLRYTTMRYRYNTVQFLENPQTDILNLKSTIITINV